MPIRQYVSMYVRQYTSGAVCLSVRADLPFQMSVSVHVHLFALLLHRFCPQRNIQICRSVSFPPCVAAFGFVPVACFQMSVSVHVHLFALLLHRFCPQRNIQICRSVSFPPCVAAFGFVPVACGVLQPLPGVHLFALLLHRFCPQRNIQICRSVSFPPCVAAFGFVPVACGVLQPLPGVFLPRTFAPKRQGNVPDAHTAPGSVSLLGSRKVSGDRYLRVWLQAGLSPIRPGRILISNR